MSARTGIRGWGFAIPRRRLANKATQAAWGRAAVPGSRAVCGSDEDALTLGAEAALNATDIREYYRAARGEIVRGHGGRRPRTRARHAVHRYRREPPGRDDGAFNSVRHRCVGFVQEGAGSHR